MGGQREYRATLRCGYSLGNSAQRKESSSSLFNPPGQNWPLHFQRGHLGTRHFQTVLPQPEAQQILAEGCSRPRRSSFSPSRWEAARRGLSHRCGTGKAAVPRRPPALPEERQKVRATAGAGNESQSLLGRISPTASWCAYHRYLSRYGVFECLDNYPKEVNLGDIYRQQENRSDKRQIWRFARCCVCP